MTDLRLVTNSVSPTQVRETEGAYIIEDVPFHKPKENLDGGYTPRANVARTADGWAGVPATLFHVRDRKGKPLPAHTDPDKHIGAVEDPHWDGERVRANFRIEKTDLDRLGGQADAIRDALDNGDPIEVSSQYASTDLPPGEYDGAFRSNATAIVRPDSVAILPEGSGRCSIEDGCGINPQMAANADVTVPMTDDPPPDADGEGAGDGDSTAMNANQDLALTDVGPGDFSESDYTDAEWDGSAVTASLPNPSQDEDAADVLDATHLVHPTGEDARQNKSNWKLPFRSDTDAGPNTRALVAIDAALSGGRGGVEGVSGDLADRASSRVQSLLEDAPDDLFGGDTDANSFTELVTNTVARLWPGGIDDETTGAESPADDTDSQPMNDTDKIDYIVANSELSREHVEQFEDTECLGNLHDMVKANADGDGSTDDSTDDDTGDGDVIEMTEEQFFERVDQRAEARAEEIVANREDEKEKRDLASTIVANSAEYDATEDVLEDYPTVPALEAKRESVTAGDGLPGRGVSANAAQNGDDELTEDVSAGVFN